LLPEGLASDQGTVDARLGAVLQGRPEGAAKFQKALLRALGDMGKQISQPRQPVMGLSGLLQERAPGWSHR